jgi:hypothetical protein
LSYCSRAVVAGARHKLFHYPTPQCQHQVPRDVFSRIVMQDFHTQQSSRMVGRQNQTQPMPMTFKEAKSVVYTWLAHILDLIGGRS